MAEIFRGCGGSAPAAPGMCESTAFDIPEDGRLAANITHFARALRKAGLRIGPGRVIDAIRAVAAAG